MGALLSYLKWRGDGSFAEHPYNEVDGLALALLSYTRFTNIIPPPFIDAEAIKRAKADSPNCETDAKGSVDAPADEADADGNGDILSDEVVSDRNDDTPADRAGVDGNDDLPADETGAAPEPPVPLTPLPLSVAAEKCLADNTGFDTPFADEYRELLREIGKTKRFGNLILSDYVSVKDDDESLLFSALCIDLPDGTRYISYRGTGVEIEDWRQDFMISFQETPAQKMALNYLLNELLTTDRPYRLGGHSKGANLALYAAMMLPEQYRDRIVEIYNADGPGICPEFRREDGYKAALSVMKRIIPEFSVIGRLFEPPAPATIVASSERGILQHDALSWQIEGSSFVTKSRTAVESDEYKQIFSDWIESADMEDREAFTEDFFDALRSGGADTVDDIAKSGLGGFGTILYSLIRVESQTKVVLGRLFRELLLNMRKLHPNDIISTKTGIAGLALLGLGILFLALPNSSYHIVGYTAAVIAVIWCIWRIFTVTGAEMRASERQARVLLLQIPLLSIVFIACHPKFIPFIENIIVGLLFLWLAERFFRRSLVITAATPGKIILIVISVLFTLLGIFSVAAPSRIYSGKSLTIGGFLALMGVALLFSEIHRIMKSPDGEESQ